MRKFASFFIQKDSSITLSFKMKNFNDFFIQINSLRLNHSKHNSLLIFFFLTNFAFLMLISKHACMRRGMKKVRSKNGLVMSMALSHFSLGLYIYIYIYIYICVCICEKGVGIFGCGLRD